MPIARSSSCVCTLVRSWSYIRTSPTRLSSIASISGVVCSRPGGAEGLIKGAQKRLREARKAGEDAHANGQAVA